MQYPLEQKMKRKNMLDFSLPSAVKGGNKNSKKNTKEGNKELRLGTLQFTVLSPISPLVILSLQNAYWNL